MRTAIAIAVLSAATTARADDATDRAALARAQDARAREHLSQPGADPWLISTSASLFTRPSFFEGVKLASDTSDEKSTYSVTISSAALLGARSPFLDGLQASVAYGAEGHLVSYGAKWNLDFRDVRLAPHDRIRGIAATIDPVYTRCFSESQLRTLNGKVRECESRQNEKRIELYDAAVAWLPSFSVAAGSGYHGGEHRRDKSSATVAADFTGPLGPTTFTVTANAEWNQLPPDMSLDEFRSRIGGGAQVSDTFTLGLPVTIAVGGKLFACISSSCGKDSSVELAVAAGIQVQKGAQVGITLTWAGSDGMFGDALAGIAFSYSLVPPSSK